MTREIIRLQGVEKVYNGSSVSFKALKGIDLLVEENEFVAIMGASGSGKSTLLNILGCLDQATAGTYFLDGVEVNKLNRDQLAEIRNQKIGFVFQSFNLLQRTTALENVELPLLYCRKFSRKQIRERAEYYLQIMGLGEKLFSFPNQLSGGQQQRIAIARALITEPAILLADEPTGNLDSKSSLEIMEIIQKLNSEQKMTIILVTHEHDIAVYAKRVVELRDGLIIRDNPQKQKDVQDEMGKSI